MCNSLARIQSKSRLHETGKPHPTLILPLLTQNTNRESVPEDAAPQLRDMLLELTGRAITSGQSKVTLRKLFVAVRRVDCPSMCTYCEGGPIQITSLAIKLHPGSPTRWPDWLRATLSVFSNIGVPREHLMDFLAIVAEEVETADLLPPSKFVSGCDVICAIAADGVANQGPDAVQSRGSYTASHTRDQQLPNSSCRTTCSS